MNKMRGYIQLISISVALWFFIWHVTPVIVANVPLIAQFGDIAEEYGITPSALYYTDVHLVVEAERRTRDAVRYAHYRDAVEATEAVKP